MAKTSNQKPIEREAVRLLAIEYGVREAARKCQLPESTVKSWSSRYQWLSTPTHPNSTKAVASSASKPGDVVLNELQELEAQTRTSLARSAQRMAKDAESATLRDSPYVHKAAQVAGIAFKWRDDDKPSHFTLNTLNINTLSVDSVPDIIADTP